MQVVVKSSGAELSVNDSGGKETPIVFVSGGPGMPNYLPDVANLVSGRRVVWYDQRGTGDSTVEDGDYSVDAHVADLESIRVHLNVEQLHIFGHSWGGLLAQLFATAHIESVASLFLSSPTPGVGADWVAMEKEVMLYSKRRCSTSAFAMMGLRSLVGRIPGEFGHRALRKMYAQVWMNYQRPEDAQPADPAMLSGIGRRTTFETRASAIAMPAEHLNRVLPAADFPFLIIFGGRDIYGEHTQVVTERYPNATTEFWDKSGHLAWVDDEPRFKARLNDFYKTGK